jgi:ferritin
MRLPKKIEKALNDQLNLELTSAYAYLGMAAHFENTPFAGFAKWMQIQSKEELEHAHKFYAYLAERNGVIQLQPLAGPKCEYPAPIDAFRASLGHEQKVSASICAIYELAIAEKDYPTISFLKWFLDEQVEEEKNVSEMLARLELVGENHNGLFQIDQFAARRAAEG